AEDLGHALAILGNNGVQERLIILIAVMIFRRTSANRLVSRAQVQHALEVGCFDPKQILDRFRQLPEPLLAFAQLLFYALALGNVLANSNPGAVREVKHGPRDISHAAIPYRNFEIRPFALRVLDELANDLPVFRVRIILLHDIDTLAVDLLQGPAQRLLPLPVYQRYLFAIAEIDHHRHVVEDGLENLFLPAEIGFHPLAPFDFRA